MVFHLLGSAYGWTPDQILDMIGRYGEEWLTFCIKRVIEDKVDDRRWLISVAPLARSPQDKKSARALHRYSSSLHNYLDSIITWRKQDKQSRLLKQAEEAKKQWGFDA